MCAKRGNYRAHRSVKANSNKIVFQWYAFIKNEENNKTALSFLIKTYHQNSGLSLFVYLYKLITFLLLLYLLFLFFYLLRKSAWCATVFTFSLIGNSCHCWVLILPVAFVQLFSQSVPIAHYMEHKIQIKAFQTFLFLTLFLKILLYVSPSAFRIFTVYTHFMYSWGFHIKPWLAILSLCFFCILCNAAFSVRVQSTLDFIVVIFTLIASCAFITPNE